MDSPPNAESSGQKVTRDAKILVCAARSLARDASASFYFKTQLTISILDYPASIASRIKAATKAYNGGMNRMCRMDSVGNRPLRDMLSTAPPYPVSPVHPVEKLAFCNAVCSVDLRRNDAVESRAAARRRAFFRMNLQAWRQAPALHLLVSDEHS